MSNMKVVALIAEAKRESHVEVEAIAQDVFAALTAATDGLRTRIEALEAFKAEAKLIVRTLKEVIEEHLVVVDRRLDALEREVEELRRELTGDGR